MALGGSDRRDLLSVHVVAVVILLACGHVFKTTRALALTRVIDLGVHDFFIRVDYICTHSLIRGWYLVAVSTYLFVTDDDGRCKDC